MTAIQHRSDIVVQVVDHSTNIDDGVARAAWISTESEPKLHDPERVPGLINYLMAHRHGTPFEHNVLTVRVEAPIMVFREWQRHRIESYNEQSGRYSQFLPNFYFPPLERPLRNTGTSARPQFEDWTIEEEQWTAFSQDLYNAYQLSWDAYEGFLKEGIANEMARLVLPVAVYSSMYATANIRGWLHFLSLRTSEENATWKGHPQWEIVQAAKQIDAVLTAIAPHTMAAFNKNGRVAP